MSQGMRVAALTVPVVALTFVLCTDVHARGNCLLHGAESLGSSVEISAAVDRALADRVLLRPDRVDVSIERGTATLNGTVSSLLTRKRAAEVAGDVKGVKRVENRIVVRPHARRGPDEIESSIIQALVVSPATESFEVDIEAEPNGSVLLSGTVDSRAERELVQRVAETVLGVTAVRNELEVRHRRMRLDSEIAAEIDRTLQWDASIDDTRVDVHVRDGIVTLSGWVDSLGDKVRATTLAWTAGTRDVDASKLQVFDSSGCRTDRAWAPG